MTIQEIIDEIEHCLTDFPESYSFEKKQLIIKLVILVLGSLTIGLFEGEKSI